MKLVEIDGTKYSHHSGYIVKSVTMPVESVGHCKNCRRCKNFNTDLANGYCTECWDREIDQRKRNNKQVDLGKVESNGRLKSKYGGYRSRWGNGRY